MALSKAKSCLVVYDVVCHGMAAGVVPSTDGIKCLEARDPSNRLLHAKTRLYDIFCGARAFNNGSRLCEIFE